MGLVSKRGDGFRGERTHVFVSARGQPSVGAQRKHEVGGGDSFFALGMSLMGRFGVMFDRPGYIDAPVLRTPLGTLVKKIDQKNKEVSFAAGRPGATVS